MAWCRQSTSHYLNQCWPRSQLPYGVTRPQWVKTDHDVMTWKRFPHYWPFVRGIHQSVVGYPQRGPINAELHVLFLVSLTKLLNKQCSCWWFDKPWCSCHHIPNITRVHHEFHPNTSFTNTRLQQYNANYISLHWSTTNSLHRNMNTLIMIDMTYSRLNTNNSL